MQNFFFKSKMFPPNPARQVVAGAVSLFKDVFLSHIQYHPKTGILMLANLTKPETLTSFKYNKLKGFIVFTDTNYIRVDTVRNLQVNVTKEDIERTKLFESFWTSQPVGELDIELVIEYYLEWLLIYSKTMKSMLIATRADVIKYPIEKTLTNMFTNIHRRISENLGEFEDIIGGNILMDYSDGSIPQPKTFHDFCKKMTREIVSEDTDFHDEYHITLEPICVHHRYISVGPFWEV